MGEHTSLLDTPAVRERLPLVPVVGDLGDEDWSAFLDIEHLADTRSEDLGLPWPGALPGSMDRGILFSQRVAALEAAGGRGAYAEWLRANGIIRQCPVWCIAGDHPRAAIWDPGREQVHVAYRAQVAVEVSSRSGVGVVEVEVSTFEDEPARVVVWDVEMLTADEAMQLAAVLEEASAVVQRITV